MAPEPVAPLEARLKEILGHVNEWLRFAEAKNGATVAAGLAIAAGCIELLSWEAVQAHRYVEVYLTFAVVQVAVAVAISIMSFLPITDVARLIPRGEKKPTDNLIYFGDLMKYSPEHLLRALDSTPDGATQFERFYAEQVIVNARIATLKLACSKWAVRLFLSALITPVLVLPLVAMFHKTLDLNAGRPTR